jgi:uncharacterized protein YcaQ
VTVHTLSRTDARRLAVRSQLLDAHRPAGMFDVVRRLTLLQNDPTSVVAPSADLVLWSRIGSSYSLTQLRDAIDEQALLELHGYVRPWRTSRCTGRGWPSGPAVPHCATGRRAGGTGWPPTTAAERRLRALGIARARAPETLGEPNDVGAAGEPAMVEGVKGEWRVDPELLDRTFTGRAAVLSPLDRLVYDRKRLAELFEYDYQMEMYKPAAKRRWGYWALPILYRDRLVGKLDATADRRAGVLRVDAIHQDVPFTKTMTAAVQQEIKDLANWLRLTLTAYR